jgi:prepilin-type N-terminal cleavage/methylation domain-containing protein
MKVRNNAGFTAIEIVAVLLIVGVIGAVVVSKLSSSSNVALISETETLKSHLRYAQLRAMSDNVARGIRFNSGSYTLQIDGADATEVLPSEDSATHSFQTGVSKTAGATSIAFDRWGSPGASNQTVTLSTGGTSRTITLTQNTGFIP